MAARRLPACTPGAGVHADVHPTVLANVGWLLSVVDSADLDEPSIVDDLQREIKFVGHTALLALRLWVAERKVDSIALNLAATLEQTILHDLVAQPAVVFAPSACGAVVLAVMPAESNLCPGDVLIDIYVVDVRGLPPAVLQLTTRGPAASHKELRVLRDGQGLTLRASLSSRRDILEWQPGVAIGVAEEQALHDAPLDLMRCVTNAVTTI